MLRVIIISDFPWPFFFPELFQHKLNAMLRGSRLVSNCAIVGLGLGHKSIEQRALIAAGVVGIYQQALPLESLCCPIDVVALGIFFLFIDQEYNFVQVLPGLDIVKSSNDDGKFSILFEGYFLNSLFVGNYFDSRASFLNKLCHHISFVLADILLPEDELPIQVCEVYRIHVDQMNFSNPTQGQIFDYFAPQAPRSNHQDRQIFDRFVVARTISPVISKRGWIGQDRFEVPEKSLQGLFRYLLH